MAEQRTADPPDSEDQIVAQLVRDDDAEVDAVIAQKVEELLKHNKRVGRNSKIVIAAEEVNDSATFGSFQRRTLVRFVILVMLVFGGAVVGLVYFLRARKNDVVPSPSSEPTTLMDHGSLAVVGENGLPATVFPLQRCQGDCDSDNGEFEVPTITTRLTM
jgi:hypothetical protein